MTNKECTECPMQDVIRFRMLMEKRIFNKFPAEVREPLQEAKKQIKLAIRNYIDYRLQEEELGKPATKPRPIGIE